MKRITQVADLNTSDWIVIPEEFVDERYKISVDPARLSYNFVVEMAERELDLTLKNTGTDSMQRSYVGKIGWQESMNILDTLGVSGMQIITATDFLRLLGEGAREKIDVYTESGKKLDSKYLGAVRSDIIGLKNPWRAEWLDDSFERREGGLYVLTRNKTNAEKLDENTLMQNRTFGINLESWISNPTSQGFPRSDVEEGELYYCAPKDERVARFVAIPSSAGLYSDRNFSGYADLGVRAVKQQE